MINTKQVVPALVAVTLLSLAPAAEALAIEEHAQAAKPAAMAADKPAAAKPAEAKADTKKDAKADVKTQAPAATDPAKETPAPSVEQAQKAYDNGSYEEAFIIVEPLAKLEHPDAEYLLGQMYAEPETSFGDITRYFEEQGIKVYGKSLTRPFLSQLLRNPVYAQADLEMYEFFKSQGAVVVNDAADFAGTNGC